MSLIERWWHVDDGGDDPQAMYWTDSEDTARLARESGYGVVEYVPEAQLAGAVEERDRYWQALVDIAGHENWEPKTIGDIARAALDPPSGGQ